MWTFMELVFRWQNAVLGSLLCTTGKLLVCSTQIWNSSVQLAGGGVPAAALCFLHTIRINNCVSAENTGIC